MVKLDISIAFKDTRLLLFVGRYRSQEIMSILPAGDLADETSIWLKFVFCFLEIVALHDEARPRIILSFYLLNTCTHNILRPNAKTRFWVYNLFNGNTS